MKKYGYLLLVSIFLICVSCQEETQTQSIDKEKEDMIDLVIINKTGNSVNKGSFEDRLQVVLDHLNIFGLDVGQIDFVLADYNRVNYQMKEIVFDVNANDQEMIEQILKYYYGDKLHYGLMYGLAYDIADKAGLSKDDLVELEASHVEDMWQSSYLDSISFDETINEKEDINLSEALSVSLVSFLTKTKGYSYVFTLMENMTHVNQTAAFNQDMIEWAKNEGYLVNEDRRPSPVVFYQDTSMGHLNFDLNNIKCHINLEGKDAISDLRRSLHDDPETFYRYIFAFLDEIKRLEDLMGFNHKDFMDLTINFYPYQDQTYGGIYHNGGTMDILSFEAISHEYVHFVDEQMKWEGTNKLYKEMRATYYSYEFELLKDINSEAFYRDINLESDKPSMLLRGESCVLIAEEYLDRRLTYDDRYKLLGELYIQASLLNGQERLRLFDEEAFKETGYPWNYWYSLYGYMMRTYEEAAVLNLLKTGHLGSGYVKSLDDIIDDWYAYIEDLSSEDYDNSYN